ncbi:MAG: hypothetical protein F4X25_04440, partial [Chloroflexi bacterium]|nr:hypothetical protein [Chloroflexota bacterium]
MAILNVSRDSPIAASVVDPSQALARARELREQGAAIIDVGAHSTSSRAAEIGAQEEIERVAPVIEALSGEGGPRGGAPGAPPPAPRPRRRGAPPPKRRTRMPPP